MSIWERSVWMCLVCVWVSDGQSDLPVVLGASRSSTPGQGATATATSTPRLGVALARKQHHLELTSHDLQGTPITPLQWVVCFLPGGSLTCQVSTHQREFQPHPTPPTQAPWLPAVSAHKRDFHFTQAPGLPSVSESQRHLADHANTLGQWAVSTCQRHLKWHLSRP